MILRRLLLRLLAVFLILLSSPVSPLTPEITPVSAAASTPHSFYFSGIRSRGGFQVSDIAVPRSYPMDNLTQMTLDAWIKRVDATRNETVACNDHSFSYCLGFQGGQIFFITC